MWLDKFSQIKHTHVTQHQETEYATIPETSLLFSVSDYPTLPPKG